MPLSRLLPLVALAAVLVACGNDGAPAPVALADLVRCDITQESCQRAIFESVAESLDADSTSMPSIRTISVEQFEKEVRSGVSNDDLMGDDPETRGLRLIGFIPDAAESATETEIDYRVSAIAAYYSSGSGSITVIDRDYEVISAQSILAHEFVHAIQDQQFGIRSVYADVSTTDGVMGARTVIEGDATYSSFAWVYEQLNYAPDSIDWDRIYLDFQEGSREQAADLEIPITASASGFPYSFGIELIGRATQDQGLSGRAAFLMAPPPSALASMLGYEGFVTNGFTPIDAPEDAFPSPVAESELALEDRYGAWYVLATLLRLGFNELAAWVYAGEWRGDELGIFESGSEVVAVWRIRFAEDPSFMVDAINESDRDVAWSAVAQGNDVFIIAAESDASLALWEAQPLDVVASVLASVPDVRKGISGTGPLRCNPPRFPVDDGLE
ncbi:MAG: hypothetical protein O7F08_07640 [Deltaproteobacteria bacterium]|nr:hypothetical protein [Deltaproteobacteria bacterium]